MNSIIRIVFLAFAVAWSAAAQDAPLWVLDKNACFPDAQFVSALGSGTTVQGAGDDAVSQISLYFDARVAVERGTYLRMTEGSEKRRAAESTVSVSSDAELPLLSFTAPFRSDKSGEWFVCAYIERPAAAEFYRSRLDRILAAAERTVAAASGRDVSLADVGALAAAKDSLSQADRMVESLSAISRRAQDGYDARILRLRGEVGTLLGKATRGATFRIAIQGDGGDSIATVIGEILAAQGLSVSERGRYCVSGSITLSLSENDVGVFVRPGASLRVIDGQSGESVYSFVRQYAKWGHKTESLAREKAIAEVEKDLRAHFRPAGGS